MKSAASTRHARVLEDMAATACAEESAPAWTWRGWAGGWAGERVRAGGLGRADGGSLGLGRSEREEGEEGGRRVAGCAEAAATVKHRVERTSSWPLKQKPVLPRFPLPRWTHRMHR